MQYLNVLMFSVSSGALYGAAMAVLTVGLNITSLKSLGSMLKLLAYFALSYVAVLSVPYAILFMLLQKFAPAEYVPALFLLAAAFSIAVINIINRRYNSLIWWTYEKNVVSLYAMLLIAIPLSLFVLPDTKGIGGLVAACSMLALSLLALVFFYFRGLLRTSSGPPDASDDNLIEATASKRKIIWFGIDSATWEIVNPLVADGKLPNLGALIKSGCHGSLKTIVPTHSPVVWTSKATGKLPLKHAVRDFLVTTIKGVGEPIEVLPKDPFISKIIAKAARLGLVKRRPVSSLDRKCLSAWNIFSAAGYKVGVTSWFVTDPVEIINDLMIPESYYMMKRNSCSSLHPSGSEEELCNIRADVINIMKSREGEGEVRDRFGIDGPLAGIQNRKFQILKDFYFQDTLRRDSATYACDNFDLDVLMVYFHGVDAVQHHFWKQREIEGSVFRDTIASYHVFMDEILGEIIKMIPGEKTVFVTQP
jgi:hypothetical protein